MGWFRYLLRQLMDPDRKPLPEITITGESVTLNQQKLLFNRDHHQLRRVHLRETGTVNILEIMYQKVPNVVKVIRIPVPKGKLRNAMLVQECLGGSCR